ncbi:M16 family metallopeptidase [Ferruginibacter sp. SUN106]|uniref:M16 family metallopeptidase n=1 Tax=Ferruginibacter sp. SUN106 TaxID=2978348 RepID=UPI003D361BB8
MLDRTIPPPIKDAIEFELQLKPYTFFELDNGVPVYTIDAGTQEVFQLELVFYAGNSFELQKAVAGATNFLLKNGTSTKTAFEINEAFEYYGAHCARACYNETAVINLSSLSKHLDKLLPVIKEMITDSVFLEEELATYKQNSKQRLSVSLKKSEFVAARLIDAYVYGEQHPYGTYTNPEDIDALNTAQLKEFFKQYYINGSCVIFVSGKLPADLKEQLNKNFGGLNLKANNEPLPAINPQPATEKKYRISNDAEGVQGAIRIARHFPNRHHPDFMKVMVLNTLFGGYFGSRLMSNIREDKGYTYGIHSYVQNHLQQTAWLISTEAGKDVSEATVEEVYKEMKLLREELVDEEELLLVRNYLIGTILGDLDGPFQIMGRWKNIILNKLDEKYFYDSIHVIKTISAEEIRELAKKYLNPEDFYELIVI